MDLQDLGSIGELIGGIAVVASVIYLTIQIRHGITGYQSNILVQTTTHFSNLQMSVASEPLLLEAFMKAEQQQPLTPMEQRRVINIVSSYLIGFENMHSQVRNRMMSKESYESRRIVIASFLSYTGAHHWWSTIGRNQFPRAFVEDVDQAITDFDFSHPTQPQGDTQ